MEREPQTFSMDVEEASSSKSKWKYHVFLSFRGEDTRINFTDHLYAALWEKGIITYRDDEELERGQVIKQDLLVAIEESLCAIVILSQNYASSTWCLDELLKILESKKELGRQVFPIFYGVDPSDVRNQRATFAEAFRKHEKNISENKDKVQKWRHALEEVANLSGWDTKNRHEAKLIEEIVAAVWTKLQHKLASDNKELVGIDSKMKYICSCLRLKLDDVRFIGIWGMGGIGKTTLATVVFNKIKSQFDISCFLANIREVCETGHGLVHLQRELLSHLNLKSLEIESLDHGKDTIRNLLCCKKVLLVLDDMSDESQLENLAGNLDCFGSGSRVILTTRDMHLLTSNQIFERYKIKILEEDESLQLLCQIAFESNQPPKQFLELSIQVVQYAGGLPLALKVLGLFLLGRDEYQWKEILFKIKEVPPNKKLMKTLKISYDGLPTYCKTMFLDIACFFKGWPKDRVAQILEVCDNYASIGMDILVERSLVTCDRGNLEMHGLLQELGRSIVFEENPIEAGKRSKLWSLEDIDQVLKNDKGSDLIEGISLELPSKLYDAHWHPKAFSKTSNLKLLLISCHLQLPLGLKCLSSSLKVLEWKGYPLKDLPVGQLDAIVDLKMHHSKIKKLWNGTHFFGKLKFIDLSHSKDLVETPIVSEVPHLERLVLEGCIKLVKVHPSIGEHKNLILLNLKDCVNLKSLPSKLEMNCLKHFILSGCLEIKKLPEFGENMKYLAEIDLKNCKNLVCLPKSICSLISLRIVNIAGCLKVCRLPCHMDQNVALEELDVSGTAIKEIISSNISLENLKILAFGGFKEPASISWDLSLIFGWVWKFMKHQVPVCLAMLPLSRLSSLRELNLSYCNLNDGSIPDDLGCLRSLWSLDLSGNNFSILPAHCIATLPKILCLSLNHCARLESLPVLPPYLRFMTAKDCDQMEQRMLDLEKFWKLLVMMEDWSKIFFKSFFFVWGSEIPFWFENQNYVHDGYLKSIIVDIPDHFHSSEWCGIVVCLALETRNIYNRYALYLSWTYKLLNYPNDWMCEAPKSYYLPFMRCYDLSTISENSLFVEFVRVDNQSLRRCENQIQFHFYSVGRAIRKVGCRVLCKENEEECRKAMMTEVEMLSNSKQYFNDGNKSLVTLTEIINDKRGRDEFEGSENEANANTADEGNTLHLSKQRKLY